MKKLLGYFKKVHFFFMAIPIFQMNLYDNTKYHFDTRFLRIILIPALILTIYLAYEDLKIDEPVTFFRARWIGFDGLMIIFSVVGILYAFI